MAAAGMPHGAWEVLTREKLMVKRRLPHAATRLTERDPIEAAPCHVGTGRLSSDLAFRG